MLSVVATPPRPARAGSQGWSSAEPLDSVIAASARPGGVQARLQARKSPNYTIHVGTPLVPPPLWIQARLRPSRGALLQRFRSRGSALPHPWLHASASPRRRGSLKHAKHLRRPCSIRPIPAKPGPSAKSVRIQRNGAALEVLRRCSDEEGLLGLSVAGAPCTTANPSLIGTYATVPLN